MVKRKAFVVRVEIDIYTVGCPGACLDPSADITLQLRTLDSTATTLPVKPVFPLLYRERIIFTKVMTVSSLAKVQKELNDESFRMDLLQWPHCSDKPIKMAHFCIPLSDLLFPSSLGEGLSIDLLMESNKSFIGKVSPKVKVSTKTSVEETTSRECEECNPRWRRRSNSQLTSNTPEPCRKCNVCNCHSGYFEKAAPHRSRSYCRPARQDSNRLRRKRRSMDLLNPLAGDISDTSTRPRSTSRSNKRVPYRELFYDNLNKFYQKLHQNSNKKCPVH